MDLKEYSLTKNIYDNIPIAKYQIMYIVSTIQRRNSLRILFNIKRNLRFSEYFGIVCVCIWDLWINSLRDCRVFCSNLRRIRKRCLSFPETTILWKGQRQKPESIWAMRLSETTMDTRVASERCNGICFSRKREREPVSETSALLTSRTQPFVFTHIHPSPLPPTHTHWKYISD